MGFTYKDALQSQETQLYIPVGLRLNDFIVSPIMTITGVGWLKYLNLILI